MIKTVLITSTCIIFLSANLATTNEINRWIDEQGNIHYETIKDNTKNFMINDETYNTSFEELNKKVTEIIANKKDSNELKKFLTPLYKGMTTKEVFNAWGKQTKLVYYEKDSTTLQTVRQYTFIMGITLYFKNDKLTSWKTTEK